jgi:DNA-binding GntR family transcriptional regulator
MQPMSAPQSQTGRSNLADEVAGEVRREILHGELAPGTRLLELRLAERFGTSQTPIREALRLLERDGLVTHRPRRGVYVWEPTARDVDEIYSLRGVLEGLAARRAAVRVTSDDAARLKQLIDKLENASQQADREEHIQLTVEFHAAIVEVARHERLLQSWRSLMAQMSLCAHLHGVYHPDFTSDVETHRALLAAVMDGEPELAERIARGHVTAARDDFIRRATAAGLIELSELDAAPDVDAAPAQ